MRKKVLFHQDNAPSHKSTVAMTKLRIELWIDSSSILFSGFGPVWLFSVPKLKNLVRWEEILVKWGSHCRRQWVFCRLWDDYFKWLLNVNYASFLAEIWPEGIRRVDLSRCRVIKWIVAPFHENLSNLSNDPCIYIYIYIKVVNDCRIPNRKKLTNSNQVFSLHLIMLGRFLTT